MKIKNYRILAGVLGLGVCLSAAGPAAIGSEAKKMGEGDIPLYKDMFDQAVYSEGLNQLDLGRWGRKLFGQKIPSAGVNIFDEVPDSAFFTNRHARQKMSPEELEEGPGVTPGPDLSAPLQVLSVEQEGAQYEFLVEDFQKARFVLRFDPQGWAELNTAADVIGSRFYHAIGYNVPETTILFFTAEQLIAAPEGVAYENTGFTKKLTQDLLQQYLLFVPLPNGVYRASASKVPDGERVGNFSFTGRSRKNPQDLVNHRDLREIRALGIFAAWLNHYEMLESNTLDVLVSQEGMPVLKHYLTDFTNTLGADTCGAKEAMFGHEHMVDYGETFKAILGLGFWERPWQKKQRSAGSGNYSPAVGRFNNDLFDPAGYKNLLPYETFRQVTRADGFWAAKVMMGFSDGDIRAMVKAGRYSLPEDGAHVAGVLSERRDMIAAYWFSQVSPLDLILFSGNKLSFKDLAVLYGFVPQEGTVYLAEMTSGTEKVGTLESVAPEITVPLERVSDGVTLRIDLKVSRPGSNKALPPVTVLLSSGGIREIRHAD